MKKFCILWVCLALAGFVSCQKQQTEGERKAEIDRQVEQRLAAERQAQEKDSLAQRAAELDAREKALSEQQKAPAHTPTPRPRGDSVARSTRDSSEDGPDYNMFYTKLDRYGDWRETSDYGYVWQPREAERSRNWHPYTDGRWVYTDAGWTWVSEEPFGWATYHYGRWARLRNVGWVWVPGDEWAPAWVSWRKSNDYVGWAPLPPEARFDRRRGIQNWSDNYYDVGPDQYRFVATREFGSRQIGRTVVPREQNVTIINQTTNVTNITYSNTVVINQGPSYEELRTRSQQPIERLRLERQVNVDLNVEVGGPVVRGEVIAIPAPVIAVGRPVQRPRTVKAAIAQTIVEHGWEDIGDKQAAEQARTKMKSESTPPPDAPPKIFVKPAVAAETGATASATPAASASPSATATATATVTAAATVAVTPARPQRRESPTISPSPSPTEVPSVSPTVAPKQSATPSATATPPLAVSPTATAARIPKPLQTIAPAATAAPIQSPVTGTPARRITTFPTATASPSASPTATSSPAQGITGSETPASSKPTPPRRRPPISPPPDLVPLVTPTPGSSPEAPPRVGERLKSQAKKFAPPGDMPMASPGAPTATPTSTAVSSPASAPASPPATRSTMAPSPTPSATPAATGSPDVSGSPESKQDDKKQHKHDGGKPGKPGESVSPTPTPTPTPGG